MTTNERASKAKKKHAKGLEILSSSTCTVVLNHFKLLKSWDDDNEEDLDITLTINGQPIYNMHNENHDVGPPYGAGRRVTLYGVNKVTVFGTVTCADYHCPYYGQDSKDKPATSDTVVIGNSLNGGAWEASFQIIA